MKNISFILSLALLISCADESFKYTPEQLRKQAELTANGNNQIIDFVEGISDVTAKALLEKGIAYARSSNNTLKVCNPSVDQSSLIDRTHYDTTLYVGTMTIDYKDGELCNDLTHTQKGKIIDDFLYIVNYKKRIFTSRETITFKKYLKDSVEIDGTIIIRSASSQPVTIETEKTTITYADGTSVIWNGLLSLTYNTGGSYTKTIEGTINGLTRKKEYFTSIISTPVVYNYNCHTEIPLPVSGKIFLKINNETSEVSYGNGNCDSDYSITIGSQAKEYKF